MEKKSNKGFIITIVILSILLLGAVGYIAYDKFYLNDEKETVKEEQKTEEKLSEEEIKKLHGSLITSKVSKNTWGFYYKDKLTIDNISSELLVKYAIINYINEKQININSDLVFERDKVLYNDRDDDGNLIPADKSKYENQIISKKEIDNYIKEKFNTDKKITLKDKTEIPMGYMFGLFAYYNINDDSFYLYSPHRGGGLFEVANKFIEAKQEGDFIYIYDKAFVCAGDESGGGCEKYFELERTYSNEIKLFDGPTNSGKYFDKNQNEMKPNKEYLENGTWNFEAIFEDFDNEINTFKHTFKKAENGNYYWYSSEVVKEQ